MKIRFTSGFTQRPKPIHKIFLLIDIFYAAAAPPILKGHEGGRRFLFVRPRRLGYIFNDVSLVRRPTLCARRLLYGNINKPAQRKRGPKPSSVLNAHNVIILIKNQTEHQRIGLNEVRFHHLAKADSVGVFVSIATDNFIGFVSENRVNHDLYPLSLLYLYYIMHNQVCQGVVSGYNNIFSLRPDAKTWIFSQFQF